MTAPLTAQTRDCDLIDESRTHPEAFAALFDRYSGMLYRYVSRRLGPEIAEDLVGETFLVAFARRSHYDLAYADARPWLRRKTRVVNIPRDSIVRIPACESPGGSALPARTDMINSAFHAGGLSCAWKTVESTTGIHVDHAVEIHFSGFKGMVDALGGVEVTLPRPVDDRKAKLRLPAGRHMLNGEQALGYVRLRNFGDGTDLERIKRQHRFMNALVMKASGLLDEPTTLSAFLAEVKKSIRTDAGLDLGTMYAIARGMAKFEPGSVTFSTVPTRPHPEDPNRLAWDGATAERLFAGIRRDAG
ncbi:LCP family glycopolymer transferase [Streptosporangium sp. LJ11]|uniref:LCP family glycopolymer transferase n=1 Tax=Streptosporangium sp. LJ11 TaxID=3436927 RepID=UPI003F7B24B0